MNNNLKIGNLEDFVSHWKLTFLTSLKYKNSFFRNKVKIMRSEVMRIQHELQNQKDKIKENTEKIKVRSSLNESQKTVISTA